MNKKKTPYSVAYSLRLVPVDKISHLAIIQSRAFISFQEGDYNISVVPGTFLPDVQSEESEGGIIYNVAHSFNLPMVGLENEQLLLALSKQNLIAIYTNEAGKEVVFGTLLTPLSLTYSIVSGRYQCKLTGTLPQPGAFYSPF